jgi:amidase
MGSSMAVASDVTTMNGVALGEVIRSRRVSCVEVMDAFLDRIELLNPRVNAIVSLRDRDACLADARFRDQELARGVCRGPLHGFPHAVKDLAPTKGIPTTQGSPIFKDFVPDADAIVVERLKAAGAIVIGKTNTPEFGLGSQTFNPVFGITRNAYDQTRTAGGSSGGAAVALALRMLPLADGSDHGGSLRNPAAFNNVLGFRPSFGRVPGNGRDAFLSALGVPGPMARTVPDLAMLLRVMAGYDPRAPLSIRDDPVSVTEPLKRDLCSARIAFAGDFGGYLPFEPGVLDLCRSALPAFERLGARVEEAWPVFPLDEVWRAWLKLRAFQTGLNLKDLYADPAKRALMKPEARWEVESGAALSAYAVGDAGAVRTAWYEAVARFFERYDYLLIPSAQVFPFDAGTPWPKEIAGRAMDTYHRWMEVVIPVTMSGSPALNVPVGFNRDGLPMGLQIVAPIGGELACLQLAHAYEGATGWVEKHPPPLLWQA